VSSLYDILYKFREYIVLVLAVLASFLIIFSNDSPEVHAFQARVVETVSFIQKPFLVFRRFGDLEEENNQLQQEIVELSLDLQKRNEIMLENLRLRRLLNFRNRSQLGLHAAKIINRGGSTIVNSITIDVGASQGVQENRAVVVADGVVGKTIQVANSSSLVQLLTDVNFRISVKTRRTRANGILVWERENLCSMENVPKTLDIQPGDTLITSGYSDIFPEGLLVGEVISSSNEIPGYYKSIQVRAFVDFNQLEEVFVVQESPAIEVAAAPDDELMETPAGEEDTQQENAGAPEEEITETESDEPPPSSAEDDLVTADEDTASTQAGDDLEALINEAIESLNAPEEDLAPLPVQEVPEFQTGDGEESSVDEEVDSVNSETNMMPDTTASDIPAEEDNPNEP